MQAAPNLLESAPAAVAQAERTREARRADLASLQAELEAIRRETGVPALGVALVDAGGPVWVAGLGQARRQPQQAADADTLFRVGSISKLVLSMAVLRLVEQGRLDLDAPLRQLAPDIAFDNPWEASHPLRLVHLLEHTTGWEDMHPSEAAFEAPDDLSLSAALALRPQTRRSRWVPGTRSAYSNLGALAAAHVVARVSGMPYEQFVDQSVFAPLGMKGSSFFRDARVRQRGAELYASDRPDTPLPYWQMFDRPSGALNSSAADMARLLQLLLRRGGSEQGPLLSAASVARMETPSTTLGAAAGVRAGWGLGNESSGFARSGLAFQGHDGALAGGISRLVYSPSLGVGYVLMQSNDDFDAFFRLAHRLHRHLLLGSEAAPAARAQPLPAAFAEIKGWYRHISPRRELTRFSEDLLELSRFEPSPEGLRQHFLMGGEQTFVPHGPGLLAAPDSGLPTLARVQDPLVGDSLQIGANAFQPVSSATVYGLLALWLGWLLLAPLLLLAAALAAWRRWRARPAPLLPPLTALAAAALLLLGALLAGPVLGGGDADFGRWTASSAAVWLGGIGFAGLTLLALPLLWRARGRLASGGSRWPLALLLGAAVWQIGVLAYLLSYGVIGMRTWV